MRGAEAAGHGATAVVVVVFTVVLDVQGNVLVRLFSTWRIKTARSKTSPKQSLLLGLFNCISYLAN